MKANLLLWTVALTLSTACCLLALEVGEKAPLFKLNDQFGKTWDLNSLEGEVVVIVCADRHSGRAMDPWVSKLKSFYSSRIRLLGLLDLHTVPGLFRGIAKSRIRKETTEPLMLDFRGEIAKAYLVDSKQPSVVVVDRRGVVQGAQTSAYSEEAFGSVRKAIDRALQQAMPIVDN